MKPYAVAVTIGEKVSGKEFDTREEMFAFLQKAEGLKKKAPSLSVRIIRNGIQKAVERVTAILDDKKEDSPAWQAIITDGVRYLNDKGEQVYRSVVVPAKRGVLYCPYCCSYKAFKNLTDEYGSTITGCETCEISNDDFHVRTVNNLWKSIK